MPKINIGTFNLDKDGGDFPKRVYKLSEKIKKKTFDILCIQEDFYSEDFSTSNFLNIEFDYNVISTKTREKIRNQVQSSSNLTVMSKYPMELLDEIYFNKGQEEERAFQVIKVDLSKYSIILINTHLCHLSTRNREDQIQTILDKIKEYRCDLKLFIGDLNSLPSSNEIKKIKSNAFTSINKESTHEDNLILDYIFYKSNLNIDIQSSILLNGFSDHHCLLNSFKIEE